MMYECRLFIVKIRSTGNEIDSKNCKIGEKMLLIVLLTFRRNSFYYSILIFSRVKSICLRKQTPKVKKWQFYNYRYRYFTTSVYPVVLYLKQIQEVLYIGSNVAEPKLFIFGSGSTLFLSILAPAPLFPFLFWLRLHSFTSYFGSSSSLILPIGNKFSLTT